MIAQVPRDVWSHVFLPLNLRDYFESGRVCKLFYQVLTEPALVQKYYKGGALKRLHLLRRQVPREVYARLFSICVKRFGPCISKIKTFYECNQRQSFFPLLSSFSNLKRLALQDTPNPRKLALLLDQVCGLERFSLPRFPDKALKRKPYPALRALHLTALRSCAIPVRELCALFPNIEVFCVNNASQLAGKIKEIHWPCLTSFRCSEILVSSDDICEFVRRHPRLEECCLFDYESHLLNDSVFKQLQGQAWRSLKLQFRKNCETDLMTLCQKTTSLERLELEYADDLSEATFKTICALPHLEKLKLFDFDWKLEELDRLSGIGSQLSVLDLNFRNFTSHEGIDEGLVKVASSLTRLETLYLHGWPKGAMDCFDFLIKLRPLKSLRMDLLSEFNKFEELFKHHSTLKTLNLEQLPLLDEVAFDASLPYLSQVSRLLLEWELDMTAEMVFTRLKHLPKLKQVLFQFFFEDSTMTAALFEKTLPQMSSLESLTVVGGGVDEEDMASARILGEKYGISVSFSADPLLNFLIS